VDPFWVLETLSGKERKHMKYNVGDIFVSNFVVDKNMKYILTLIDEWYEWDKQKRYQLQSSISTDTIAYITETYTEDELEYYTKIGELEYYPVKKDNI
jgi:hypothetical protein